MNQKWHSYNFKNQTLPRECQCLDNCSGVPGEFGAWGHPSRGAPPSDHCLPPGGIIRASEAMLSLRRPKIVISRNENFQPSEAFWRPKIVTSDIWPSFRKTLWGPSASSFALKKTGRGELPPQQSGNGGGSDFATLPPRPP